MSHHMTQSVAAIQVPYRRGSALEPDVRSRLDRSVAQSPHIMGKPYDAVGIDPGQICRQKTFGNDCTVSPRHANRTENPDDERTQDRHGDTE